MSYSSSKLCRALHIVVFLFLAGNAVVFAQKFTVEQIMGSPFPSRLTAAESASRIAWVFNLRGAENIWIADGPNFVPRQITDQVGDAGDPIKALKLTSDGSLAVFVRGTELNGVGQSANPLDEAVRPKEKVWAVDLTTGKPQPRLLGEMGCEFEDCEDVEISPDGKWVVWEAKAELWIASLSSPSGTAKQLTEIRGSVYSPRWSPDGTHLAATVDRRDHSFISILDVTEGTLKAIHFVEPSTDRDSSPRWSPDGRSVVFLRKNGIEQGQPLIPTPPIPWSVWVADSHTYRAAAIWKSGFQPRDSFPDLADEHFLFAADNRVIFGSESDGWNHLYSISALGGPPTLLTPGAYDVEDVSLTADKKSVLFSSNEGDTDRRHLWKVNVRGDSHATALTKGETIEWSPIETGDRSAVFCLGSSATTPALVYRLSHDNRELITKNALPDNFPASSQLVAPADVTFKSADGVEIHGQLFVPKAAKKGPALIFVHGGPRRQMMLGFHYRDYYHNAYAENQYLVSLGFTVLSVNYRLGTMYGHDFREAPYSSWRGATEYEDIVAGAHYLQKLATVDPHRIGIWGGSYGGWLVALALARNSDIFASGVDFEGVHDQSALLAARETGSGMSPDYEEAKKLAFTSSPVSSVATWRSPVLMIQGDDDRNVPFSQMVSLVQKLRKQGVSVQQIVYPDEIHDFLLWKDWVRSYEATAAFFTNTLMKK